MTTKTDDADRELLELAAKSAGIERGVDRLDCGISTTEKDGRHRHLPRWNPLEDDGDALRLAVQLHLWVQINHASVEVECWQDEIGETRTISEYADPDSGYYAPTRRAIVRAAAEIERNKL